jgi:hypothetical protein
MVKSKHFLILVSIILFSCERKIEKSVWDDFYKVPYSISEKNIKIYEIIDSLNAARRIQIIEEAKKTNSRIPNDNEIPLELPPPNPPYSTKNYGSDYASINIVFYKNGIYIHRKGFYLLICGTGLTDIPEDEIKYIDLRPNDFTEVSGINHVITEIKKSRLIALDTAYHFVYISSLSDTITNPAFNTLMDSVRVINPHFYIRRITEEEHHVLDAKTRNVPYDPKNYKWMMNYNNRPL